MKKTVFVIYMVLSFVALSCTKSSNDINQIVCSRLKSGNISAKEILDIKKEVIYGLKKSGNESYGQYIAENKPLLEACFRTIRFRHGVTNNNPGREISGSASSYLSLDNNQYDVILDERESIDKMQRASRFDLSVNLDGEGSAAVAEAPVSGDKNDARLNELDALVNEFSQTINKALNDDLAAMASYPDIYKKAEDKLSSIKSRQQDLSPKQKSRLSALEKKLRQAAAAIR